MPMVLLLLSDDDDDDDGGADDDAVAVVALRLLLAMVAFASGHCFAEEPCWRRRPKGPCSSSKCPRTCASGIWRFRVCDTGLGNRLGSTGA